MRLKTSLLAAVLVLVSGAAWAAKGFHYKSNSVTTGSNIKSPETLLTEAWVVGPNAKIVFLEVEGGNPVLGEGKFVLTNDGGKTVYLVDPVEKTHAEFDLDQLVGLLGSFTESGMFDLNVSNHSVELVDSSDGPAMHGYDTEYRKYLTTYDVEMKVVGLRRADHYVIESEIWSVPGLQESGFEAWNRPRKTGFDAVDTLMDGEFEKIKGFSFKTVVTTRTEGAKKKKRTMTTTSTTEVTDFAEMNVDNSMFELASDSREVSLVDLGALQAQDPDGEPEEEKGGFMKRLKKIRKGDG